MKTRRRVFQQSSVLCLLCFFVADSSSSFGAPPAITHLHPAGAERGTTVEVTAAGTLDPWPAKVWASGKGITVEPGKTKGKFAVTATADAAPGVYWLRAHNADGASALRPFFVGTVPEVAEKEPNDDPKKPQAIEGTAVTVNGKLDKAGDVDGFAVSLKKGQTLVASLEANRTLKSPMDAVLQIVSADGFVLDENHDYHGLDPQLAFTAPKDGTYTIRLFAFPSQPDSSIRFFGSDACAYRLTLTTGPFADHALPLAVARTEPEPVEIVGWNIPEAARMLRPASAEADWHSAPGIANPFRLRVEPHPVWNATTAFDRKKELVPPFSLGGRLTKPGSPDTFTVVGKKGQPLAVEVQSRVFGLALSPVVRVLDATGKQLARAEAALNSDTALSFAPTADGPFTVEVSDTYAGAGPRFAYLLRVLKQEPDYELTVASDRFAVVPGKPTSIPVKVVRKNGFAKPVEVLAKGLPEGVKLEVTPPAKPDPNTVTVSLTAEKPASGTFRLVGKVKDEPKLTRIARPVPPDFDGVPPDLWVTAAPGRRHHRKSRTASPRAANQNRKFTFVMASTFHGRGPTTGMHTAPLTTSRLHRKCMPLVMFI